MRVLLSVWWLGLCTALALGAVAAWPFVDTRFVYFADDGQNHAIRTYVLEQLLRRGAWYPRWWPDLGFGNGMPILNFYSPGIYYLAMVFRLVGASTYRSLQYVGLASCLLGAAGGYVLGTRVFRRAPAGVVLAGAYVLGPYVFATNLYLRSAFPEALGLGVLPWLLAAGHWVARSRAGASVAGLALALAALVLSHSLTALVAFVVLCLWLPACAWTLPPVGRAAALRRGAAGAALGLALSAFFWLPALLEQDAVHTELGRAGNLSPLAWLFDPIRERAFAIETTLDEPYRVSNAAPFDLHLTYPHATAGLAGGPAKPGLGQAVFLGGALLAAGVTWRQTRRASEAAAGTAHAAPAVVLGACALICAGAWFLNTVWSEPVWRYAPLLPTIQFPWRLWGPFSLALACLGAGLFAWVADRGQQQWVLAGLLVALVGVNGLAERPFEKRMADLGAMLPWPAQLRGAEEGARIAAGTTTGGEFLPRSVILAEPLDLSHGGRDAYEDRFPSGGWIDGRVWPWRGPVLVEQTWEAPEWVHARVTASEEATIAFRSLAFPGWRAYVDGRPVALETPPFDPQARIGHGFALVRVPPGTHEVQLAFGETAPRVAGWLLTIGAVGVLAGWAALGSARRWGTRSVAGWTRQVAWAVAVATAVLAGAYLVWALRPLWGPSGQPGPETQLTVHDLTAAPERVRVSSPAGGGLGDFVNVRWATIGGEPRRWLFMHPPAQASLDLVVPPRAVFQAGLGLEEEAWDRAGADGVRFVLEIATERGARATLLDEVVQPQIRAADRGWRFAEVDLSAYAGQRATLTLRTEGRSTPDFDWAGWATPRVYSTRSVRHPAPTRVAPAVRRG